MTTSGHSPECKKQFCDYLQRHIGISVLLCLCGVILKQMTSWLKVQYVRIVVENNQKCINSLLNILLKKLED